MRSKFINIFGPFFGLFLFAIALFVLHHELKSYHLHEILTQIGKIPASVLFMAFLLTLASYGIMSCYDAVGMRYVGHFLSYSKIALASFIGYAFSNNIGLAMLAGGSVRYRLYSAWGLSVLEITQLVAFCTLSLWVGFFTLGGIVFVLEPMTIPEAINLHFVSVRPLGLIFLCLVCAYFFWVLWGKRPFKIRHWEFPVPSPGLMIAQMTIAFLDWSLAGSILYTLLPSSLNLSWTGFLGVFLLAQLAGLASQLPGGLGVFETVVVLLLSPKMPAPQVLGALLAYRGIYYIFPLLLAAFLLGVQEIIQKKETLKKLGKFFGGRISALVPLVFACSTFVGGAILLFSGSLPAISSRIQWLKNFLPLPFMELSHFLGSLVGVMLLLLSRGIQLRLDAAYIFTNVLLGAGILFSMLKGLDYEEATVLFVMMVAFLPCRKYFYRKGSLVNEKFSAGWIAAIILVLTSTVWLGFFSYRHVAYSSDLWWHFTLFGQAPRFLRAMVGAFSFVAIFMVARLLKPAAPTPSPTGQTDLASVSAIVSSSGQSYANLAMLGDKSFLFTPQKSAFIMYGVEGRSWIAMGDPIGPREEWPELVWNFREMSDRYNGWPVFYEVGQEALYLYIDLGLNIMKLGEEGKVPLEAFSLEGSARKGLRYTSRKLQKEGCVFEIVPKEKVSPLLPEFKSISDRWLREKNTREKKFSLGFFDEDYLKHFSTGVVRKEGKILGFANILTGAEKNEFSIDLMRYLPEAPNNLMEYLFIQLMLWGKEEGYQWFNLGMAPLSGLEDHWLAPRWSRLGAFVFNHGEHFYNLQGLRTYKQKFDPVWAPKYLATQGGLALPHVMANIASLVSGGMKGVIAK